MPMRVVVNNSVTLNGGDAAILLATIAAIRKQLPNADIRGNYEIDTASSCSATDYGTTKWPGGVVATTGRRYGYQP